MGLAGDLFAIRFRERRCLHLYEDRGRGMKEWQEKEKARAVKLRKKGWSFDRIAKALGRTEMSVRAFIIRENRSPEEKRRQQDQENECRKRNRREGRIRSDYIKTGKVHFNYAKPAERPTPEMMSDRDVRACLPRRDLTAVLLGDPPIGLSALDRPSQRKRPITLASHA